MPRSRKIPSVLSAPQLSHSSTGFPSFLSCLGILPCIHCRLSVVTDPEGLKFWDGIPFSVLEFPALGWNSQFWDGIPGSVMEFLAL